MKNRNSPKLRRKEKENGQAIKVTRNGDERRNQVTGQAAVGAAGQAGAGAIGKLQPEHTSEQDLLLSLLQTSLKLAALAR